MIGFETIGNATAIFYDDKPILATDPWIDGAAYFGSWGLSHEIPKEQLSAIETCSYIWLSHGHPDHINTDSLEMETLKNKTFLVADHYGDRIANDLKKNGKKVKILKSKKWVNLTKNIKIMTIADYNQDSILLIQIGNDLVCNLNDSSDRGWGSFVKKIASNFKNSFLLRISGYGDATMINYRTEDGNKVLPSFLETNKKTGVGALLQQSAKEFGTNYVIPFSSLHRYQREDSAWANKYVAEIHDYKIGFTDKNIVLTDPFIRWDCSLQTYENINPETRDKIIYKPEDFGDSWIDDLSKEDKKNIEIYFKKKITLADKVGFVRFKVGKSEYVVNINKKNKLGFTFEVPRSSLMKVIEYEIFDDILIGNYAKLTVHNEPKNIKNEPIQFLKIPLLYGDQSKIYSKDDLNLYMEYYSKMFPLIFLKENMLENTEQVLRKFVNPSTTIYNFGKKIYKFFK